MRTDLPVDPMMAVATPAVGFGTPYPVVSAPAYPVAAPQPIVATQQPIVAAPQQMMAPTADYWGQQWNTNSASYQWEVQNLRRELEWAYQQLRTVDVDRSNAQTALQRLREAEAHWAASDAAAKAEIQSMRHQNHDLTQRMNLQNRDAQIAHDRLIAAERNWQQALQHLDAQRWETNTARGQLEQTTAQQDRSRASLVEQLEFHKQQLARAQDEIRRLRPCEAQFGAVTSEVEYLRSQTAQMRQLEDRFASVCKEAEMLRAQLLKQEHNIDRYTHQTESFYHSANSENAAVKKALSASQDELRHLDVRYQDAVEEIHHAHDQVRRAEKELTRLRSENDRLHDFVSEAVYLKHLHGDQTKAIDRMERALDRLEDERDGLQMDLDRAVEEIARLNMALGDEASQLKFAQQALNEEIADNKTVRRQLNEEMVHQKHIAASAKNDAASLSNEAQVKELEMDRLQKRLADTTAELDRYTALYQEALTDVDRLKAALTEEITEHKYARGIAEQQMKKADMAVEELERVGARDESGRLRAQLGDAESEIIHLRNVIAEYKMEFDRAGKPYYRDVVHEPVTVGYRRGEPVVKSSSPVAPHRANRRFAYFGVEVAEGVYLSKSYGEGHPIPAVRVVNTGGPCAAAGLKPGDLISSINGRQVGSLDDFNYIVSSVEPRTEVKIIFERDGKLLGTDVMTEETKREPGLPGRLSADDEKPRPPSSKRSSRSQSSTAKPLWKN